MKKMMLCVMMLMVGTINGNPVSAIMHLTNTSSQTNWYPITIEKKTNYPTSINCTIHASTIGFVGGYTEVVTNYSKTFISLDDLNNRLRSYVEEATVVERTMIRYTINGIEGVTCVGEKNLSRRQRDVKVEAVLKTNNWIDLGSCSIGVTSNKVQADVMTSSCWMVNLFDGKTNQFSISPQFQPTPVALGK